LEDLENEETVTDEPQEILEHIQASWIVVIGVVVELGHILVREPKRCVNLMCCG
jgi:hypothetical protein